MKFDYWPLFNPIAYNFGLSECNRDKMVVRKLVDLLQVHLLLQQYCMLLEQVQKFLLCRNNKKDKSQSHFSTGSSSVYLCHKIYLQQYLSATLLTQLHSERPKLCGVLAFLSAIGLIASTAASLLA